MGCSSSKVDAAPPAALAEKNQKQSAEPEVIIRYFAGIKSRNTLLGTFLVAEGLADKVQWCHTCTDGKPASYPGTPGWKEMQKNGTTNIWGQFPKMEDAGNGLEMGENNKMITYLAKKYDKQPANLKDYGLSEQALGVSEGLFGIVAGAMYPQETRTASMDAALAADGPVRNSLVAFETIITGKRPWMGSAATPGDYAMAAVFAHLVDLEPEILTGLPKCKALHDHVMGLEAVKAYYASVPESYLTRTTPDSTDTPKRARNLDYKMPLAEVDIVAADLDGAEVVILYWAGVKSRNTLLGTYIAAEDLTEKVRWCHTCTAGEMQGNPLPFPGSPEWSELPSYQLNAWGQLPKLMDAGERLSMSETNKMTTYLAKKYDKQPANLKDYGLSEQALGVAEGVYNTVAGAMYPQETRTASMDAALAADGPVRKKIAPFETIITGQPWMGSAATPGDYAMAAVFAHLVDLEPEILTGLPKCKALHDHVMGLEAVKAYYASVPESYLTRTTPDSTDLPQKFDYSTVPSLAAEQ
jgi:glutathione S-transferase